MDTTTPAPFIVMVGTLAYVDTPFSGLIPCKVTEVHDRGHVVVKVTASRGAYRRGEALEFVNNDRTSHVVPRTAVYVRGGQYRIVGRPVHAQ